MTTSPFLVPLIIESLLDSRFAARTEVIPEEADPWCAVFARNNEALILTDDSDLAIYDIGNGKVSFLGSLTKQRCERCTSIGIFTRILQPDRFALDFSTTDIKEAAYKLHVTTRSSVSGSTMHDSLVLNPGRVQSTL